LYCLVLFCHIHLKHISLLIFSKHPTVLPLFSSIYSSIARFFSSSGYILSFLRVYMFSTVLVHISLIFSFLFCRFFYLTCFLTTFFILYFHTFYFTFFLCFYTSPLHLPLKSFCSLRFRIYILTQITGFGIIKTYTEFYFRGVRNDSE